jgi:hypothetical protein
MPLANTKGDDMTPETRSKYADYIASALRHATTETGKRWPKETVLVVQSYAELAEIDDIIGMKIYIFDMPSPFDFAPVFPSQFEGDRSLLKAFREYTQLYDVFEETT